MQTVGEFDDDNANILRHGDEHTPIVFLLLQLFGLKLHAGQLRHAVHQHGDFLAKLAANIVDGVYSVFHHVMQKCRTNRHVPQVHLGEDIGDVQRVNDISLPALAGLPKVRSLRQVVGVFNQPRVCMGLIGKHRCYYIADGDVRIALFHKNQHALEKEPDIEGESLKGRVQDIHKMVTHHGIEP